MRSGRPINEDRQNAIALGLREYTGTRHARCGTNQRYVAGGGCAHCARLISAEQRAALNYLKRQTTLVLDDISEENIRAAFPLDSTEEDGLEADDAAAREEAAIDELM
jgi:hypothetical protein